MALTTFYIKQGDRLPPVEAALQRADGTAVTLAGATVKFLMRVRGTVAPVVVDAAAVVVDAGTGQVRYDWADGDTATVGDYDAEFEVTVTASGKKQTVPNNGYLRVKVRDDIG